MFFVFVFLNSASGCNDRSFIILIGRQLHLTPLFGGLVVGLTDQPAVLHQVILVTCSQLPLAHDAGKTVQVIDEVLRSSHHLCGRNPLLTRRTFGPESPFEKSDSCQSIPNKTPLWCKYDFNR